MQATQAVKIKFEIDKLKNQFHKIRILKNQVQIDRRIVFHVEACGNIKGEVILLGNQFNFRSISWIFFCDFWMA